MKSRFIIRSAFSLNLKAMKNVIFKVSIHPIDFELLDKLKIRTNSLVKEGLEHTLSVLVSNGYTKIQASVEDNVVKFHCKK